MSKVYSLLAALLLMLLLFACGKSDSAAAPSLQPRSLPQSAPAATAESEGKVLWLSSDKYSNQILQLMADQYRNETGKSLEIICLPESKYDAALEDMLSDSGRAPSIIEISGMESFKKLEDRLYNLSGSELEKELSSAIFNLKSASGELLAVPLNIECSGIIVNTQLLSRAGASIESITSFETLKKLAESIHSQSGALGFDAFTSSPIGEEYREKYIAQTANPALFYEFSELGISNETPPAISGSYLENYRNLWNLYIQNSPYNSYDFSSGSHDPLEEFGSGKAVFYQGSGRDYETLTDMYGMYDGELAMIPMYSSASEESKLGLGCGCERYLAVNKNAKQEDIKASLEFIKWMLTSPSSTELLSRGMGALPYKSAVEPVNIFWAQALDDISSGKTIVTEAWRFIPNMDAWCEELAGALTQYNGSPSDQSWAYVQSAFVDQWKP